MSFVILYVTHANKKAANKIVDHLLKKKLIACSNAFSIESSYVWKGKSVKAKEIVTLLKTHKKLAKKVEKEITSIHPYEVPCIIALPVPANKAYENWVAKETKL